MNDSRTSRDSEKTPATSASVFPSVRHKGENHDLNPEDICALVVAKMKESAEAYLGENVTHAVVAVSAHFNAAQRQATKDACENAGLRVLRIVSDCTAAAIAYGLDMKGGEQKIIVYNLGGGSCNVSLLSIDDRVFEVLATAGGAHLGGEDFDNRAIDYLVKQYMEKTGTDVSADLRARGMLKREVEKAKRSLSSQQSTLVEIESFENGIDFSETLTRTKFEELNMDLFLRTLESVDQVLKDAGVEKYEIDEVVLVGGSTRIPKVQHLLKEYFGGKEPLKGINPDEAVVLGAAMQGGILGGLEGAGDALLIEAYLGTLGIETKGGVMTTLIPRNTAIPTKKSRIFSTATDNQKAVLIRAYEGGMSLTKDNNLLGKLELTGIPPAPRGVPQIEVTIEIDADGITRISAIDKGTGNSESITIKEEKDCLSHEEHVRVVADAAEVLAVEGKEGQHGVINSSLSLDGIESQVISRERLVSKLDDYDKKAIVLVESEGQNNALEEVEAK